MRIALLLMTACGPTQPGKAKPDVETRCALDPDNALRVQCSAEAGPLELWLVADGAPERRIASDTNTVVGWGLRAQTTYQWALAGQTGTVTTGPLPDQLDGADLAVTGTAFGFDAVLQALRCAEQWMVMIDGEGHIVWYEPTAIYSSPQDAYEWAPVEQEMLIGDPANFRAVHVSGKTTLRLDREDDYTGSLHHDLSRWNRLTYLLFEEDIGDWWADGFHVFHDTELLGTFRFTDHFDPPAVGDGDWTHSNGINVTEDGVVVLSLRNQDQVFAIDGDPLSPDFLEILWSAAAGAIPLGRPTFIAADGWTAQHNASFVDNRLWLFDNLFDEGYQSRVARYELDVGTGEALLDAQWVLPEYCPIQGGALPLPGGVLASCATSGVSRAYYLGETEPAWTLDPTCIGSGNSFGAMTRSIPVTF